MVAPEALFLLNNHNLGPYTPYRRSYKFYRVWQSSGYYVIGSGDFLQQRVIWTYTANASLLYLFR